MIGGEALILRFHEFNGGPLSIEQLKDYHAKVQAYLDSIGSGPYVPELKSIGERVTTAMKKWNADKITDVAKVEIGPAKMKMAVENEKPKIKTVEPKPSKKRAEEKAKPNVGGEPDNKSPLHVIKQSRPKEGIAKKVKTAINGLGEIYGLEEISDDTDLKENDADVRLGNINSTVYEVITNRILDLIKGGGLIWRQPWNEKVNGPTDLAHNYVTKHQYGAGNYYLNFLSEAMGGLEVVITKPGAGRTKKLISYKHPFYFTFKQVSDLGGKVNADETGWPVVYFKWLYKDLKRNVLIPKEQALDERGKLRVGVDRFPGLFYYTVFNYAQTSGLKINLERAKAKTAKEKIDSAEKIVADMPNRPTIKVEGKDAWYRRDTDTVQVPPLINFKKEQFFYSVEFHELIHSTGHASRVNREREMGRKFGDKNYAFEELIAELGSSFLCGESGILYYTMKNSAAYIKGWSKKLVAEMERDPKFYLQASSQAQKAADFILGKYQSEKQSYRQVAGLSETGSKKETPKQKKKIAKVLHEFKAKVLKTPQGKVVEEPKQAVAIALREADVPKSSVASQSGSAPKPTIKGFGFVTADKAPEQPANTFTLPGEMGTLLGKLQGYKLEIVIAGETHSSKSQLGMQLADAFAAKGDEVAWLDWEQGGLDSVDTQNMITRNVKPENKNKIHVSEKVPRDLEAVKGLTKQFKVIAIDSGSKLNQVTNAWIDTLREEHPDTVWIIMMQQNEKGGTRGGSAAEFDSPVVLKTYRPDQTTHEKNYATVYKNRGNRTGLFYSINEKKIISDPNETKVEPKKVEPKEQIPMRVAS